MIDEEKASLKVREWLVVAVTAGIIAGLACLASFKGRGEAGTIGSALMSKQGSGFDVLIKGAVAHPGIYHINSEIKMQVLLAMAGVNPSADLHRFSLDTIVKKGRTINVPTREMIEVHLKGAVAADQTLSVPKNSKLEDLIAFGDFSPNADLSSLKKKRKLKPGEIISIPFKK